MKASRSFTVETLEAIVRIHVWGTCEYDYEAPSRTCPGGQSFDMLTLDGCHVEYEKKHDEAEVVDGDWHPCGGWLFDFEIHDEAGTHAYCKAWGIDPMSDMEPDDIDMDEGPDGPDPDDQRDMMVENL